MYIPENRTEIDTDQQVLIDELTHMLLSTDEHSHNPLLVHTQIPDDVKSVHRDRINENKVVLVIQYPDNVISINNTYTININNCKIEQ